MTARKPLARYSAIEGALPSGLLPSSYTTARDTTAVADSPDFEYVQIDSTIVRAHQHAAGKNGGLKLAR